MPDKPKPQAVTVRLGKATITVPADVALAALQSGGLSLLGDVRQAPVRGRIARVIQSGGLSLLGNAPKRPQP